jgi:hypothetical protein
MTPIIDMTIGVVTGLERTPTTTNQWKTRGRYDRFFAQVLGQISRRRHPARPPRVGPA